MCDRFLYVEWRVKYRYSCPGADNIQVAPPEPVETSAVLVFGLLIAITDEGNDRLDDRCLIPG
jgi:hypothetical protein